MIWRPLRMIPEPVRRATQRLDALLEGEGASAQVGRGLGRAAHHLRVVIAGVGAETELAALRAAAAELEACLGRIRDSTNPADRVLEEGVAKVRRTIARLVRPVNPRNRR